MPQEEKPNKGKRNTSIHVCSLDEIDSGEKKEYLRQMRSSLLEDQLDSTQDSEEFWKTNLCKNAEFRMPEKSDFLKF